MHGATTTTTLTFNITGQNDAPVVTASSTLNYTENAAATAISPVATVTDINSANFNGGSLTVSFTSGGTPTDQLTIGKTTAGQIGVSGSNITYGGAVIGTFSGGSNGSNLVITFNSAATPDAAQALLRDIQYSNTSDNPSTAPRTVTFTLMDGDGTDQSGHDTGTATATVNYAEVNDQFLTQSYGDWTEEGDSGGATRGEFQIAHDPTTAPGDFQIRLSDNDFEWADPICFRGPSISAGRRRPR